MGWKTKGVVAVVFAVLADLIAVQNSFCSADLSATSPSSGVFFECGFDPPEINGLFEGQTVTVFANCSARRPHVDGQDRPVLAPAAAPSVPAVNAVSADATIAEVVDGERLLYTSEWSNQSFNFTVRGLFLGRTSVFVSLCPSNDTSPPPSQRGSGGNRSRNGDPDGAMGLSVEYQVAVIRNVRAVDHIFLFLVTVLVICGSVGIGCKVDLVVVKEVLVRPVAPAIGFCCQYIIMPLTAFGLVKLLGLSGGQALGFFAAGCAPGGGSSNMYTYLLGGDVSLSVTLTLVSLLASLFMIPMWLFTLGQLIISGNMHVTIPFQNIIISLAAILIPVAIGILIQKKWTKGAKFIVRCLRPSYIILILCMSTIGVYSNLYIFRLITPALIVAGLLLPYSGFLLSGLVAFVLRQPRPRILTIAIETGIQNTGLAIILMRYSLPQPEADLSLVSPVVVAMFMPLPLWVAVSVVEIRRRCCKKQGKLDIAPANSVDNTAQTVLEENVGEKLVQSNNNTVNSDPALNSKGGSSQKQDEMEAAVVAHSEPL